MDCGFYIIYTNPSTFIKKKIINFWTEQWKISNDIRNDYERDIEYNKMSKKNKFAETFKGFSAVGYENLKQLFEKDVRSIFNDKIILKE